MRLVGLALAIEIPGVVVSNASIALIGSMTNNLGFLILDTGFGSLAVWRLRLWVIPRSMLGDAIMGSQRTNFV